MKLNRLMGLFLVLGLTFGSAPEVHARQDIPVAVDLHRDGDVRVLPTVYKAAEPEIAEIPPMAAELMERLQEIVEMIKKGYSSDHGD